MNKNSSNGNYFKFILFLGVAIIVYALGYMDVTTDGRYVNFDLLNHRQNLVIIGSALFLGGLIGWIVFNSQSKIGKESGSSVGVDGNIEVNEGVVGVKEKIQLLCDKFFLSDKVSSGVSGKRLLLINAMLLSIVLCLVSISSDVSILFLFVSFFTAISPYFIRKNIKVSLIEELMWGATSFASTFLLVLKLIPFAIERFF